MTELLLQSLIELIAITTKFQTDREKVKSVITFFLKTQFDIINIEKYLKFFDDFYESSIQNTRKGDDFWASESSRVVIICTHLNKELTQHHKINILYLLFSAVEKNRSVSEVELQFLKTISDVFYIDEDDFFTALSFSILALDLDIHSQGSMIAFSEMNNNLERERLIKIPELKGVIGILKMDTSGLYYVKHSGDQYVSLNDEKMIKNAIYNFNYGDIIRLENAEPIHFSDMIAKLTQDQGKILFEVDKITYEFPNGKIGIHELSFSETSGRLVGIMGSSGAGKSTLLEVLNGNKSPKTGRVYINNIDIHKESDNIEGVIGYVPQDDLLIEDLSVFQNLYYAARLSHKNKTNHEAEELVHKVINDLGLVESTYLKVGNPLQKLLSGGQRKRLNIGLELLRAPNVLFLDEPTSGLSSRDSQNIMDLLKELSLQGKLIFVVIHQPSADIFKLFDRLLLMDTGGYPIYYGNPLDAITYFKGKSNKLNKDRVYDNGRINPEIIFDLVEAKILTEKGQYTNKRKKSPVEWYYEFRKKIVPTKKMFDGDKIQSIKTAKWTRQLRIFFLRDTFSKLNNVQYLVINALQAPVLAFLLAILNRYYDIGADDVNYTFSSNQNMPVFLFISIIVSLFLGLTVSAEEIVQDRRIMKRERFLNLSRSSYLLSKLMILFTLSAIQTLTFWWVSCMVLDIVDFQMIHWMLLFSTSAFANMLGLNISTMFNKAVTIYILIPILLIPQLVLGGAVLNFNKINPDVKARTGVPVISEFMTSRWAYEGLMVSFYMDNEYNKNFFEFNKMKINNENQLLYRLPDLESRLTYALSYHSSKDLKKLQKIQKDLDLIKNEFKKEKQLKFKNIDKLSFGCDESILMESLDHVYLLRRYYNLKSIKISNSEQKLFNHVYESNNGKDGTELLRQEYHNETIERHVRGLDDVDKIIKIGNNLKILADPIYREPDGGKIFSRTHFYSPYKYFLGMKLSTPVFNIIAIWLMTILLYLTLYYNIFRKGMGMISRKIPYLRK
jgi:ABC-type multidrug transport system ATPase subunit